MHAQLEELWIDAMEMKVGEQITTYLRKNHPEYQEYKGLTFSFANVYLKK